MDHQLDVLKYWLDLGMKGTHLIFHPPGKGKTIMGLTEVAMSGYGAAVVVAPPITHNKWVAQGKMVGIKVIPISHAKFRMKDFRLLRTTPLIVDEFHLLGGHTGQGWTKLDKAARGLQAPVILMSATPNYNDAERCYCLVHVLSPLDHRGGFLNWLYTHCNTRNNPFGAEPLVDEEQPFRLFKNAAEFLAAQPRVSYLEDDAPDILQDIPVPGGPVQLPPEFYSLNLDETRERVMASGMEIQQRTSYRQIVDDDNRLTEGVAELLGTMISAMPPETKWLIFCQRSEIAQIVAQELRGADLGTGIAYIDGSITPTKKTAELKRFLAPGTDLLVGTASMATGTDGIDKVCKLLIIVDDTPDRSLRYQLIGRILPRGVVTPEDFVGRAAYRITY